MNAILASGGGPLSFLSEFGVEWDMLLSQGLMFVLLAFVLYRFAFKPVARSADERRAKIERGLADAEEARRKLEECERDCSEKISAAASEAASIIAKTRDDARAMIEKAAADASAKAASVMEDAKAEIARDRERMKEELKGEVAALVARTAEAVFGDSVDPAAKARIAERAAERLAEGK